MMVIPLNPKEIVTDQDLGVSNILEIAVLRELLFKKGIISKEEFLVESKKLDRTMKGKRGK